MTWQEDIQNQYLSWNDSRIVTLEKLSPTGTGQTVEQTEVTILEGDRTTAQTVFSGAFLDGDTKLFIIANATLCHPNITIVEIDYSIFDDLKDEIDGDTEEWKIDNVQLVQFDSQWMCLCKKKEKRG